MTYSTCHYNVFVTSFVYGIWTKEDKKIQKNTDHVTKTMLIVQLYSTQNADWTMIAQ